MSSDYDYPEYSEYEAGDDQYSKDKKLSGEKRYWWLIFIVIPLLAIAIPILFPSDDEGMQIIDDSEDRSTKNYFVERKFAPAKSRKVVQKLRGRWKLTDESVYHLIRRGARKSGDFLSAMFSFLSNETLSNFLSVFGNSYRVYVDFEDDESYTMRIFIDGKPDSKLENQMYEVTGEDSLYFYGGLWYYFMEDDNSLMLSQDSATVDFKRLPNYTKP